MERSTEIEIQYKLTKIKYEIHKLNREINLLAKETNYEDDKLTNSLRNLGKLLSYLDEVHNNINLIINENKQK